MGMTVNELIDVLKNTPKELMGEDVRVCIDYKDGIPVYKEIYGISRHREDWFGFEPAWDTDYLTIKTEGLKGNE